MLRRKHRDTLQRYGTYFASSTSEYRVSWCAMSLKYAETMAKTRIDTATSSNMATYKIHVPSSARLALIADSVSAACIDQHALPRKLALPSCVLAHNSG